MKKGNGSDAVLVEERRFSAAGMGLCGGALAPVEVLGLATVAKAHFEHSATRP